MPVAIIPAALAAFQIGKGIVDEHNAKEAAKEAAAKIKPYKTPKEVVDVLNATQYNAQTGFDPITLNYLTNQTDNAFGSAISTAERLGGDPNALSAIFGQKIDAIRGIGAQNHLLQMQNFSAYVNAENAMAANNAAEQKSVQDQLKDQLQKIAIDKQVSTQQISSGINTGISALANAKMMKLYNKQLDADIAKSISNTGGYYLGNIPNIRNNPYQTPQ